LFLLAIVLYLCAGEQNDRFSKIVFN